MSGFKHPETVTMKCFIIVALLALTFTHVVTSASTGDGVKTEDESHACKTADGEDGVCKPFTQCYPIVGIAILIKTDKYIDSKNQLQQDILDASTPCGKNSDHANRTTDDLICCVSYTQTNSKDDVVTIDLKDLKTNSGAEDESDRLTSSEDSDIENLTATPLIGGIAGNRPPVRNTTASKNSTTNNSPVGSVCVSLLVVNTDPGQDKYPAPHSYPWMAALIRKDKGNKQFCGGSLVDDRHVLTAAHCLTVFRTAADLPKLEILLGAHNLGSSQRSWKTYKVAKIYKHAGYSDTKFTDDIALLRLSESVEFSDKIKPVCLNRRNVQDYDNGTSKATLAGWGQPCPKCSTSKVLRHSMMRLWTNEECQAKYDKVPISIRHRVPKIQPTMVCAGSPGADACQGDSGGPLFTKVGGSYFQLGIVSWGIGCGEYPGVYSRVDNYFDWIDKNRSKN